MAINNVDPEKTLVSRTTYSVVPPDVPSSADHANLNTNEPSGHTPLQLFQLLIGLQTPPELTSEGIDVCRTTEEGSRRARDDNIGLYQRAKQQERSSRIAYVCTSIISNTLYMFQIILAATFTACSAYKNTNPVTLTILGAFNTVVAGSLAWQKGQGVPQRYRKAQDQYQALILEIEMAERSFLDLNNNNHEGLNGAKLDPRAEKARLQKLFDTARADQQANYPDLYVSTGAGANGKDAKDLQKQLDDAKEEATKVQSEMMAKIDALMGKLGSEADAHVVAAKV